MWRMPFWTGATWPRLSVSLTSHRNWNVCLTYCLVTFGALGVLMLTLMAVEFSDNPTWH